MVQKTLNSQLSGSHLVDMIGVLTTTVHRKKITIYLDVIKDAWKKLQNYAPKWRFPLEKIKKKKHQRNKSKTPIDPETKHTKRHKVPKKKRTTFNQQQTLSHQ